MTSRKKLRGNTRHLDGVEVHELGLAAVRHAQVAVAAQFDLPLAHVRPHGPAVHEVEAHGGAAKRPSWRGPEARHL